MYVDVYSGTTKQGSGPITTATGWKQTTRLDRIGEFSFQCSASDPQATQLVPKRTVYCVDAGATIGAGIIDKVENTIAGPGVPMLTISGQDLAAELTWCRTGPVALNEAGWSRVVSVFTLKIDPATGVATDGPNDQTSAYDSDPATYAELSVGGVDWWWVYVGAGEPFTSLKFVCTEGLGVVGTITGQYFNGTAWEAFTVVSDTTIVGGNTFHQDGVLTFSLAGADSMKQTTEQGRAAYFVRFHIGITSDMARLYDCHAWGHVPTSDALPLVAATFPTVADGYAGTWTLDTLTGLSHTVKSDVYDALYEENAFEALLKLADITGEHFYCTSARKVVWIGNTLASSGVRLISPPVPRLVESDATIALLTSLRYKANSADQVTRVYPYGGGIGDGKLTLEHTTRTAAYYSLDVVINKTENYIRLDTGPGEPSPRVDRSVAFKDLAPATADQRAREHAADALCDAAVVWLYRHSAAQVTYALTVANLARGVVNPGSRVWVQYRDYVDGQAVAVVNDASLIVLELTDTISGDAATSTGLTVSTVDAWPLTDAELLARSLRNAQAMGSRPQAVGVADVQSTSFDTDGRALTVGAGGLVYGGSSAASGSVSGGAMGAHRLAGAYHSETGLTAGMYVRAESASAFAWASIADADLPATLVRTSRSLTAGAGLTGGGDLSADRSFAVGAGAGITVNADDVALTTPGTLSVSSTNVASGSHTHAITSSSNPGAAARLLASDASGLLQLSGLGVGVAGTAENVKILGNYYFANTRGTLTPVDFRIDGYSDALYIVAEGAVGAPATSIVLRTAAAGAIATDKVWISSVGAVTLTDAGTLGWPDVVLSRKAANVLALATGDSWQSTTYAAGAQGWQVGADGTAEFSNVRIRGELSSATFKYDEITSTAGTFGVWKSASTLVNDCTTVTTPTTFYLDAKKSDAGGALFAVNDILRMKSWTGAAILDNWCLVTGVDNTPSTYTRYTCTKPSGTNGTFRAGTTVVDYGSSGQGYLLLSADGTNAPWLSIRTHAGAPYTTEVERVRLGNLYGAYGTGNNNYYGIGIGDSTAAGDYLAYDPTNGLRIQATGGIFNLNTSGLRLAATAAYADTRAYGFNYSTSYLGGVEGDYGGGSATWRIRLRSTGGALSIPESVVEAASYALTGIGLRVHGIGQNVGADEDYVAIGHGANLATELMRVNQYSAHFKGTYGVSIDYGLNMGSATNAGIGAIHLPSSGYVGLGAAAGRIGFTDGASYDVVWLQSGLLAVGASDTLTAISTSTNISPIASIDTSTTTTTRTTEPPALLLRNNATATTGQLVRLAFAARSAGVAAARGIIGADITAEFQDPTGGNGRSTDLVFSTCLQTSAQTPDERMRLTAAGALLIGKTSVTAGYRLDVNGYLIATRISSNYTAGTPGNDGDIVANNMVSALGGRYYFKDTSHYLFQDADGSLHYQGGATNTHLANN